MNKMISKIKKSLHNTGSSLILVIVALAFIGILVGALLTAVGYAYRQKLYDYNARSNFYYLDQAMDEIYAGIGASTVKSLTDAYEKTREEAVVFDLKSKSYKTLSNEEANNKFKNYFMSSFLDGSNADYWKIVKNESDVGYKESIVFAMRAMITNNTVELDPSKMKIQYVYLNKKNNTKAGNDENDRYAYYKEDGSEDDLDWLSSKDESRSSAELAKIVIKNVRLTREAEYTRNNASGRFKQTISTDIEISRPDFDVDFGNNMIDLSTLFGYCMIADSGVDFDRITSDVLTINGNVYAASDFYNKDYNRYNGEKAGFTSSFTWDGVSTKAYEMNKVSNYDYSGSANSLFNNGQVITGKGSADSNKYDGLNDRSKYSGFYVDGGKVNILAETVIVPGSIAVMNSGSLAIYGINSTAVTKTNVWADEVILGGYSIPSLYGKKEGSKAYFNANMYIKDDTQIEADWATLSIAGEYYGFSNSESKDERSFIPTVAKQKASDFGNIYQTNNKGKDHFGNEVPENRGHYNSSAILINGENATLDLEKTTKLFIAGRSYIELSNAKVSSTPGPTLDANKGKGTAIDVPTTLKTYEYNPSIHDYKTGESVSVKPTQLAYYPSKASGSLNDDKTYFVLNSGADGSKLNTMALFLKYFKVDSKKAINIPISYQKVILNEGKENEKVKEYYYFDFEQAVRDMAFDHSKFPTSMIPDTYDGIDGNVERNIKEYAEILKKQFIKDYCDYFSYCVDKNSDTKFYYMGYEDDYDDPTMRVTGASMQVLPYTKFEEDFKNVVDIDILDGRDQRTLINQRVAELQNVTNYADFEIQSITLPEYSKSSTDLINTSGVTTTTKKVLDEVVKGTSTYYIRTNIESDTDDTIESSLVGEDENSKNTNKTNTKENTKSFAKDYLLHYNMAKYALKDVYTADSAEPGVESEAQFIKKMIDANGESGITPINYYMNYDILDQEIEGTKDISPSNLDLGEYKVFSSPGDITIKGASEITGIVVAKGDVYFDKSVNKFNGLIISGGKIYITTLNDGLNSVNSTSLCRNIMNAAISKASMYGCSVEDESLVAEDREAKYAVKFLKLFKGYEEIAEKAENGELKSSDEAKDITNIDYSDVLRYNNWMRNVD